MLLIAEIIREFVESLRKAAYDHSKGNLIEYIKHIRTSISIVERYHSIYQYEVPFLLGALRSIGRISTSDQSLISQLFPIQFPSSIHIEGKESVENGPISFRPIISKVLSKNILSSTNEIIAQTNHFLFQEDS
jgi:hypothetical protein